MRVQIPDYYRYDRDKDDFEKKFKRDGVELLMEDRKKMKFDIFEDVDVTKVNAKGIRSAEIEFTGFRGDRLEVDAADTGFFKFWNGRVKPLSMGFGLNWIADPTKDPEGKARFRLEFK
jgi:hypothetical protein